MKIKAIILSIIFCINTSVQTYAAQNTLFDFSDEAQARFEKENPYIPNFTPIMGLTAPNQNYKVNNNAVFSPPAALPQRPDKKVFDARLVYISKGTPIAARLNSTIDSASIQNNSAVTAELTEDWLFDGVLIAPEGSIISGSFVDTKQAGWAMGNGQIGLCFNKIITPDGAVIPLSANKVYVTVDGSRAWGFTKNILVGAAFGTITGLIRQDTSAIVRGALIGSAAGTAAGLATKGEDVNLPAGTSLQLRLSNDMTAEPYEF